MTSPLLNLVAFVSLCPPIAPEIWLLDPIAVPLHTELALLIETLRLGGASSGCGTACTTCSHQHHTHNQMVPLAAPPYGVQTAYSKTHCAYCCMWRILVKHRRFLVVFIFI
jgi:hypothetical protein|eukprot:SAG25_NODE_41_length_19492_cov_407.631671_21_plen_111_part_00